MNNEINETNIKSQMRKGILEYCILLVLKDSRCYVSDIVEKLRDANLIVVEGTLYTLLNRLRKEEKLTYEWEELPKGPPRKYYKITSTGEAVLGFMSEAWDEISNCISHFRYPANRLPMIDYLCGEPSVTIEKNEKDL